MLRENTERGTAALDADGAKQRAGAVIDAEHTLRSSKAALKVFGSPERYRDAVETKLPSGPEKQAATKLAQAAALLNEKTIALESVLRDESAAVVRIERAQLELKDAQKALAAALEQRERVGRSTDAVSIAYDRDEHLAAFKAAVRAGRVSAVEQTDMVASDEEIDEMMTPEGELRARVRAFEMFARREIARGRA